MSILVNTEQIESHDIKREKTKGEEKWEANRSTILIPSKINKIETIIIIIVIILLDTLVL